MLWPALNALRSQESEKRVKVARDWTAPFAEWSMEFEMAKSRILTISKKVAARWPSIRRHRVMSMLEERFQGFLLSHQIEALLRCFPCGRKPRKRKF